MIDATTDGGGGGAQPIADAARRIAEKPAEQLQQGAAAKGRGKGKGAKAQAAPAEQEAQVVEIRFAVQASEMKKVMGPVLRSIAKATSTAAPEAEEVEAISSSLAFGLRHTKIGMDEKTGPWVPFAIAASAYAAPRIAEAFTRWLDRRERAEEERQGEGQRREAKPFRLEPEGESVATGAEDQSVGVPAVGALET